MSMNRLPTGTRNTRRCRRSRVLPLLILLHGACLPLSAATLPDHDPAFDRYPMNKWVSEQHQPHFRWRVEIPPAELSTHQRLMVRLIAHVDGKEIGKRLGGGEFLVLFQYQDAEGHAFQQHAALDLSAMSSEISKSEVTITNYAFVLPGDYSVSVAVVDTTSGEHNATARKLHVAPLKPEPFPQAWAGLPDVEFIAPSSEPPDVWFLPDTQNRLNLTLKTRRPVLLKIVLNTTPTERASGSANAMRRNMSLLIPAWKMLSQIDVPNGSVEAAFLDLTHRKVPYEQKEIHQPDWGRARQFFLKLTPGIIDVSALQGHWKMRNFFHDEVRRRLEPAGDAVPIVIVLSGAAFFDEQEPVDPALISNPNTRLYYIRYRMLPPLRRVRPSPGMRPLPPALYAPMPVDDLEHSLEPLGVRIFDATSPEQFRRVVAAILSQVSEL
jgi:hypothetical protein